MPPKGTGPLKLFIKRKTMDKVDRPAKKPKVATGPTIELTPSSTKLPLPPCHGAGNGLMTVNGPVSKKRPTLLRVVRILGMPSGSSYPSSRTTIMKTWATMQLRP